MPRLWTCDRCLKREPWAKGTRKVPKWRWYFMGGEPISVFCSDECEGNMAAPDYSWATPQNPFHG